MLSRQPGDRTVPTLVTLLVVGVLLMTFDVRSQGQGVTSVLRSGTQTIVAPLQKGAAFVVNPVLDLIDSLANIATLRETTIALEREVAELEAEIIALDDDMARLEFYEQLYDLETTGTDVGRTVAEVIGRPDPLDNALIIDKGTNEGIAVGQPVVDTNGYVVGSVQQVTSGTARVIPITVGADGVAVTVGEQLGVVTPQINDNILRLEVNPAREPVLAGEKVVTSSQSVRFPAGYPVGQVIVDAAPDGAGTLSTLVEPYMNPDNIRVVVILAWPPDPVAPVTETTTTTTSTTSTTLGGSTTTSTTGGDG
ncbi:MAG TPA: rod shape-determining protein MreC [Acidimicrobiia bacterium]|nr:rod shape-determining protein MreC [Acidimicrobiia bacterium]